MPKKRLLLEKANDENSAVFSTLKEEGAVRPFEDSVGRGMFVSHQWLSPENPDPNFEQLEVLQKTMKNLLRGASLQKVFFLLLILFFFWVKWKCCFKACKL